MKKLIAVFLLAALLAPALPQTSMAQDGRHDDRGDRHEDHDRGRRHDNGWHGDIHHFRDHDLHYWHQGRWFHGPHGGRDGWWWILGGSYYFYPTPVYPYPDPYLPPVVTPVAAAGTYYYCANPRGYYPYVPACALPWRAVVAY